MVEGVQRFYFQIADERPPEAAQLRRSAQAPVHQLHAGFEADQRLAGRVQGGRRRRRRHRRRRRGEFS